MLGFGGAQKAPENDGVADSTDALFDAMKIKAVEFTNLKLQNGDLLLSVKYLNLNGESCLREIAFNRDSRGQEKMAVQLFKRCFESDWLEV